MSQDHPWAIRLALLAAVVSGALVSLQQRINGELGVEVGDAALAALVSFGVGLLVVTAAVLSRPEARAAVSLVRTVPWWQRLGGIGGATLVAVGAAAAPRLGIALATVGIVGGQVVGGLVVDRLGLAPGAPRGVTPPRLAGGALCVLAVALSGAGDLQGGDPLVLLAVVVAGVMVSLQQAVNGRVSVATGQPSVATLVNFVVGTVLLVVVLVGQLLAGSIGDVDWPGGDRWYLYSGGVVSTLFVATAAVVVQQVGVLRLGLAVSAGQLLGGVVLDLVSPAHDGELALTTLLAVVLTFLALVVGGRERLLSRS